jgi:rfaE bifunctional protein nucleotidyltransferase chain/domain
MNKSKIVKSSVLAPRLAILRRRGKKVVFTNGVYDLIHGGHITLLEKAKRLGDVLVVGLNSDSSVKRIKGPKRPIATQKDRAQVLAALQMVDFVTIFGENTPYQVIALLKPDILVKGGEYSRDKIVGRDLVKKVVTIPMVKGHSTSAMIQKVLKSYGR